MLDILQLIAIIYVVVGVTVASSISMQVSLIDLYDESHHDYGDYEEIKDKPNWEKFSMAFLVLMLWWPSYVDFEN